MDISKVLEILSKHIIKLEDEIYLKDYELKNVKEKLSKIENHLENYYGGNNEERV